MNIDKRGFKGTAVFVLATFVWTASGGNTWAEIQAARRDPARSLLRLVGDPRLAFSREEKEYLRHYLRRMEAKVEPKPVAVSAAPVPTVGTDADESAAVEMQQIAADLDALATTDTYKDRPERVIQLARRLEAAHQRVLRKADETKVHLSPAKQVRHASAQARYLEEIRAVFGDLDFAAKSRKPDEADRALAAAADRLRKSSRERHSEAGDLDPGRLPFRKAEPVKRQPAAARGGLDPVQAEPAASSTLPTAADLAETEDIQITPEIRSLAASLGNQPVRIYDWVRNNIDFYPTYGSIQGSQMTLDAKRGNAFDTASLLIAMLRAANVPARYVTGTVQVPVAPVLNWVGGAANPNVAQQLLGQGGVPNIALTSGGRVTHLRLDHVWAEAFVDNVPSRGAVQREGDTWIPLDASFKQYQFAPGSSLFTANPISSIMDPNGLVEVDESIGKISGVDQDVLDERLAQWVEASDEYMLGNGIPYTREGLVGGKTLLVQRNTVLPASLPYEVIQRGSPVAALPASLRHTVTIHGFANQWERALGDPDFSVRLSLPHLNTRRLGIQFHPATQADADTLAAARTNAASALPVYLVDVVPSIKLDGTSLGSGGSVQMGGDYFFDVVLNGPDGSTRISYQIVAGDEIVVGITGNGLTPQLVEKRFRAHPVNDAPEYLHQVHLHYWLETDHMAEIAAAGAGVHSLRLPSVGFFSSPLQVSYLFGSPRSGVYQGSIMDVKLSSMGAAGEDPARVVDFMKQAGFQSSYLEGSVFDQFATADDPSPGNRGISAVRLLSTALYQGIPVYRITQANAAAALPMLQLSAAVETDISRAVSQGKTVLTSERNVDMGAWSGAGYIIHDESTGAGAYLISGGLNGGGLLDCVRELAPSWEQVLVFFLFLVLALLIILLILVALGTSPAWAPAAASIVLFLLLFRGVAPSSPPPPTSA